MFTQDDPILNDTAHAMDNRNVPPAPDVTPSQPGPTLLPAPVAQAVSFATRSTCLAIRLGSVAGSYSLGAARFTTLSSLELARGLVETVLSRAGRETLSRSQSDLASFDAESVIERSLENLHHAMTQVVFWTTAGFHLTNTTISLASEVSQLLLSSLDQFLGSTDSSRAIASIITLIRREFRDPATGAKGEPVGVIDLTLGLCALAYLQRWCWKVPSEESTRRDCEEVIWDVVVLNDGERIDVQGNTLAGPRSDLPQMSKEHCGDQHSEFPQERVGNVVDDEDDVLRRLKDQIAESLPSETTIFISNSISTTQTITIDIDGPRPRSLPTLPGAEVIETKVARSPKHGQPGGRLHSQGGPSYRVTYKLERSKTGETTFQSHSNPPKSASIESPTLKRPFRKAQHREPSRLPKRTIPTSPPSSTTSTIVPLKESRERQPCNSSREATSSTIASGRDKNTKKPKTSQLAPRSISPVAQPKIEREANQKRLRVPLDSTITRLKQDPPRENTSGVRMKLPKRRTDPSMVGRNTEKRGTLKQVLREGSQSFTNIWHKDSTPGDTKHISRWKELGSRTSFLSSSNSDSPESPSREDDEVQPIQLARDSFESPELIPRSSSRASYVSIREYRRDSIVSQTDTYAVQSKINSRPTSPAMLRIDSPSDPSWTKTHNGKNPVSTSRPLSGVSHRHEISSLYNLASNDSQSSMVLASYYQKSAYNAANALNILKRNGEIDGIFPKAHFLSNIVRYMKFSSASYGSHFLKFMGISKEMPILRAWDDTHHDVRHFVHHTESDSNSVLLVSFVDPQGGTDSSGSTGTGVPLVHYISLDHDAKTVVLACRGTLGFEDILADLTCDYDILSWQGRDYQVHKGVHASARRLLYGGDGRVLLTLREALLEFPGYGLVLCGHSLGGAVTALLGVMLSEPNPVGTGFVTATEPHAVSAVENCVGGRLDHPCLPPKRPIHVYAYGPPGTMSPSLRKRTKGLITTIIHGHDVVPYLSLGSLRDSQAVALAFKNGQNQAKLEIRQRIWEALQNGIANKLSRGSTSLPNEGDAQWGVSLLQELRSGMTNQKLAPPGEVFTIESQRVLRRDAFLLSEEDHIGKPAQRIVLKYIKNVEARFKEMRFGTSMLMDHSPARYEEGLEKLRVGIAV